MRNNYPILVNISRWGRHGAIAGALLCAAAVFFFLPHVSTLAASVWAVGVGLIVMLALLSYAELVKLIVETMLPE